MLSVNNFSTSAPPKSNMQVLMFCFWASFLVDVSYLGAINAKGGCFTPEYVIFYLTWFFSTNGVIAKNNWL